jgi:hypothetical protein
MPFQPGQSGNPHGRPKKTYAWMDIIDSMLGASKVDILITFPPDGKRRRRKRILKLDVADKRTFRHAITAREVELALEGNTDAIKDLLDRDVGKPHQAIDHTTNNEPLNKVTYKLEGADPEELRKLRELLKTRRLDADDDRK